MSFAWTRHIARPGAVVFAMLSAMDGLSRGLLVTVIPLEALRMLGNARDMSVLLSAVGWAGVAAVLFIPALVRRLRPRWAFTLAVTLMIVAPGLMALGDLPGLAAGLLLRAFSAACLLNLLSLYIMAYIRKRDLARSEPLRTFFSAGAWTVGPALGVYLYNDVAPWVVFALSAGCAALLLVYFWWLRMEYGPALPPGEPARINPFANIRRFIAQPRLNLAWLLNFGRELWWVTFFYYAPVYLRSVDMSHAAGALASGATAMLFTTTVMGWLGRRFGLRRFFMAAFLACCLTTVAVATIAFDLPAFVMACLLAGALAAVALDSVAFVPFLRAVRARERPEMTMVFGLYRDFANLLPPALFALLLSYFDLPSVFLATGLAMLLCAWLARWIPRGM